MDDLSGEPVFQQVTPPSVSDDSGVAGEPALADSAAAAGARAARQDWLVRQWTESRGMRISLFAGLCAVSGLFAVACALLKNSFGGSLFAVILGAPLVEELGKVAAPLMVLEKKPWSFGSASSIVLVGLVSGLVFASIENLLYFFVYIEPEELTSGVILWRLIVCTALHVLCASISCSGLARAWTKASRTKGTFSMNTAVPYFVVAMVLHGVYNLGAVLYAFLQGD